MELIQVKLIRTQLILIPILISVLCESDISEVAVIKRQKLELNKHQQGKRTESICI